MLLLLLPISLLCGQLKTAPAFSVAQLSISKRVHRKISSSLQGSIAASTELLQKLVQDNNKRTPGSLRYRKSWRHWSELAIDAIRHRLSQSLPTAADPDGFSKLWFSLGVAADQGEMPSFADAGSRAGYALDCFCRARMLADFLFDLEANPTIPEHWKRGAGESTLRNPLTMAGAPNGNYKTCRLVSIGGGPGYDYVGAALLATYSGGCIAVDATIFDYEEGWHDLVDSMAHSTAMVFPHDHTCRWGGTCDITKSLQDSANQSLLTTIATADLIVCQYCIAENANALRDSNFGFFRDLLHRVKEGALLVVTETTPRLWPDFVDAVHGSAGNNVQAALVNNVGRGKSGPHVVLRKVDEGSAAMHNIVSTATNREMCVEFRQMQADHDRKLADNWKRQKRKIPGSKVLSR
jgi:hypothetical protein